MYDLDKHVDKINVYELGKNKFGFVATSKNEAGESVVQLEERKGLNSSRLSNIIGEDLAKKAIVNISSGKSAVFDNLDITIGGKGMRDFYDNIVPQVASDLMKRIGGQELEEVAVKRNFTVEKIGLSWAVTDGDASYHSYLNKDGKNSADDLWTKNKNESKKYHSLESAQDAATQLSSSAKSTAQVGFVITEDIKKHVISGLPMFGMDPDAGLKKIDRKLQAEKAINYVAEVESSTLAARLKPKI